MEVCFYDLMKIVLVPHEFLRTIVGEVCGWSSFVIYEHHKSQNNDIGDLEIVNFNGFHAIGFLRKYS